MKGLISIRLEIVTVIRFWCSIINVYIAIPLEMDLIGKNYTVCEINKILNRDSY